MRLGTPFEVSRHGYQFANNFEGMYPALCGGMSWTSLDYYYTGLPIPSQAQAPSPGDPLYDALVRRQLDAHCVAIPILMAGRSMWGTNSRATGVGRAYTVLKSWIDRGSPMPILLGDLDDPLSTNSHWVVARGYEQTEDGTCARIYLYDNNYPNQDCYLSPSDSPDTTPWFNHSLAGSSQRYGFYVPHLHYRPQDPRRYHAGWGLAGTAPIDGI